jgi:hypothetical protein
MALQTEQARLVSSASASAGAAAAPHANGVAGSGIVSIALVVALAGVALAALASGLRLPIGPNYHDVYLFVDVAHRINQGQVPHIDFFIPIGFLPFYLHDILQLTFPSAQPVLAVQYGILLILVPLALWLGIDLERQSRRIAIAVLLPLAALALLPFNIIDFYPAPGIDGYGIYNRQAGLMLYVLVAALALARSRWLKLVVAAVVLNALVYIKITAGLAAFAFVVIGVVNGRLGWRDGLAALASLVVLTIALQLTTGLPRAYIGDLTGLVEDNTDTLFVRLLTFVSLKFDVLAGVAVVGLFALWCDRMRLVSALGWLTGGRPWFAIGWIVSHPVALLGALTAVATGYETQNTGSNEFVYLWPAMFGLMNALMPRMMESQRLALVVLACFAMAPSLTKVLHKAARTAAVAPGYVPVTAELRGPLAMTLTKPVHSERAEVMARHYAEQRQAWTALAEAGQIPSEIHYSEPDYQTFYVRSVAEAVGAVRALEARTGTRFTSTYVLDFVDPVTAQLGRKPPRFVSVANDPDRTFPVRIRERVAAELATVDALLLPRCPVTPPRLGIAKAVESALSERSIMPLSRCWDIALKPTRP